MIVGRCGKHKPPPATEGLNCALLSMSQYWIPQRAEQSRLSGLFFFQESGQTPAHNIENVPVEHPVHLAWR